MPHWKEALSWSERPGAEKAILGLVVFGLLALSVLFGFLVVRDLHEIQDELEFGAQRDAVLLSEHAARLFDAAELALATLIDDTRGMDLRSIRQSRSFYERVHRLAERLPYVEAFWLHGPDGRLLMTSVTFPAPPLDASNTGYFAIHRTDPRAGGYVSPAGTTGSSRPTFRLSRRLDNLKGEMTGVASLTIEASFFRDFYSQLTLPPGTTVALARAEDLSPLVVETRGAHPIIQSPQLAEAIRDKPASGSFWMRTPGEKHSWAVAYRKVPGFPLYVVVFVPRSAAQVQWWPLLRLRAAEAVVALLVLATLSAAAFRQTRGQRDFQALLARRVAERTSDLQRANLELERAIQEVHHRVRNNLQIVGSLLNLQAVALGKGDGAAAIRESAGRVHAIGLVHQTLYDEGAVAELRFDRYLERALAQIDDFLPVRGVQIHLEAIPATVSLERAVPLSLIVHEVLSNALLHAFPDGRGRVHVGLEISDGHCVLTICDDGSGLPAGFDWRSSRNLGLSIVRSLATQIDAVADLETDHGTRFTLRWPV